MNELTLTQDFCRTLKTNFATVHQQIQIALKAAGFEIVTELNLTEVLARADSYIRENRIFVVLKPDIAQRAITVVPQVSVALLCHVVVSQIDEEMVEVRTTDPMVTWGQMPSTYLKPIAMELQEKLMRVLDAVEG